MKYKEIKPAARLQPYVKCYYLYESDTATTFDDTVFPSGCVEIIFNLGSGNWMAGPSYVVTPPVELWGQITQPLPIRSVGRNIMLGIRFFPHAAAYFLPEKVSVFNNQVADLCDFGGGRVRSLHQRLLDTPLWRDRFRLVEEYLLGMLSNPVGRLNKAVIVGDVMKEMQHDEFFDNIDTVAGRYGITSRYLQKLFLQYTGLTPKLYSKIHRFQHSLRLISARESSLTSIAYDCGYFDQSHFIREFKAFTGSTPSGYLLAGSEITAAATGVGVSTVI